MVYRIATKLRGILIGQDEQWSYYTKLKFFESKKRKVQYYFLHDCPVGADAS
jgi:hypothetical protein